MNSFSVLILPLLLSTDVINKLFILRTNPTLILCDFRESSDRTGSNSTQQLRDVCCCWRGCSSKHFGDRKHRLARLGLSAASEVRGVDSHRRARRASGSVSQWLGVKITHPVRGAFLLAALFPARGCYQL